MQREQVFGSLPGTSADRWLSYCPHCGNGLTADEPEMARTRCAACGTVHYRNPLPGVVIMVCQDSKVLVGKRGPESFRPGCWCLPGGFIEFGEDFLTAGVREVREETGLLIEIRTVLNVCSNFLSERLQTLVIVLHGSIVGGTPTPGDDLVELDWVSPSGNLPPLAFESDEYVIRSFGQGDLDGIPTDGRFSRGRA